MTVPLDVRNDIRSMDTDGVPRTVIEKRLRVSRNTVAKYADMEDMSPEPPLPERRRGPRSRATRPESSRCPGPTSGRPTSSATPPRGSSTGSSTSGATGVLLDGPQVRARLAAGAVGGRRRGLPGARVAGGDLPGRLRQLPCRHRWRGARPQAAGGDAAALERPPARRSALAGVGVHVRGAGRDIRALGARPPGRWSSTTPQRRPGWSAARSPSRGCSLSSGPTTASRPGTATPTPATRKAPSRTPWGSCDATSWFRSRPSGRWRSSTATSPRGAPGSTPPRAPATAGRRPRPSPTTSPRCARCPASPSTR